MSDHHRRKHKPIEPPSPPADDATGGDAPTARLSAKRSVFQRLGFGSATTKTPIRVDDAKDTQNARNIVPQPYSHPPRNVVEHRAQHQQPPQPKSHQICRDFQRNMCQYGDKCRYQHIPMQLDDESDEKMRSTVIITAKPQGRKVMRTTKRPTDFGLLSDPLAVIAQPLSDDDVDFHEKLRLEERRQELQRQLQLLPEEIDGPGDIENFTISKKMSTPETNQSSSEESSGSSASSASSSSSDDSEDEQKGKRKPELQQLPLKHQKKEKAVIRQRGEFEKPSRILKLKKGRSHEDSEEFVDFEASSKRQHRRPPSPGFHRDGTGSSRKRPMSGSPRAVLDEPPVAAKKSRYEPPPVRSDWSELDEPLPSFGRMKKGTDVAPSEREHRRGPHTPDYPPLEEPREPRDDRDRSRKNERDKHAGRSELSLERDRNAAPRRDGRDPVGYDSRESRYRDQERDRDRSIHRGDYNAGRYRPPSRGSILDADLGLGEFASPLPLLSLPPLPRDGDRYSTFATPLDKLMASRERSDFSSRGSGGRDYPGNATDSPSQTFDDYPPRSRSRDRDRPPRDNRGDSMRQPPGGFGSTERVGRERGRGHIDDLPPPPLIRDNQESIKKASSKDRSRHDGSVRRRSPSMDGGGKHHQETLALPQQGRGGGDQPQQRGSRKSSPLAVEATDHRRAPQQRGGREEGGGPRMRSPEQQQRRGVGDRGYHREDPYSPHGRGGGDLRRGSFRRGGHRAPPYDRRERGDRDEDPNRIPLGRRTDAISGTDHRGSLPEQRRGGHSEQHRGGFRGDDSSGQQRSERGASDRSTEKVSRISDEQQSLERRSRSRTGRDRRSGEGIHHRHDKRSRSKDRDRSRDRKEGPSPLEAGEIKEDDSVSHRSFREDVGDRAQRKTPAKDLEPISDDEKLDNAVAKNADNVVSDDVKSSAPKTISVADALKVDWASLVKDQKSIIPEMKPPLIARARFAPAAILARMGISQRMVGPRLAAQITGLCNGNLDEAGLDEAFEFLDERGGAHARKMQAKLDRKTLISNVGPYTRALSARRDLEIRRQLCGLSPRLIENVPNLENGLPYNAELYKKSVELFMNKLGS